MKKNNINEKKRERKIDIDLVVLPSHDRALQLE